VDWKEIERLRVQGFTVARRGYDRREVDKFVAALLDWIETGAAKDLGDLAVKRKLELVGKSTAHILLTTEKEAEELRAQAEEECADLRSDAEAAALEARRAADEYAKNVRERADQDARRTAEAASAKAKGIVEEAERRRAQIEAAIGELDARRVGTLGELERLRRELAATIGEHEAGARAHGRSGGENGERAQAKAAGAVAEPP
jgi:cell division septum initiation protein DivIVA